LLGLVLSALRITHWQVDSGDHVSRERGGALSETVATVSPRTEKMLSMFRLRNKNCSETGPNRRCSRPEQYQKLFRFDLYRLSQVGVTIIYIEQWGFSQLADIM